MNARKALCLLQVAITVAMTVSAGGKDPVPVKGLPNRIIFITIDTLRADHLPMYGYPRNTAPFLSKLAAEKGILYERMYSACSHTAPCHASMFTSLYPDQHGILMNGQAMQTKSPTMAEMLRREGYATGAFVSVAFLSEVMRGFDVKNIPKVEWLHPRHARGTIDAAQKWLDKIPADKKAFVWIHLFDVHNSMEPSKEFNPYAKQISDEPNAIPEEKLNSFWSENYDVPMKAITKSTLARRLRSYDARIRYTDDEIGKFFNEYTAKGKPDSLWIITADHGEGLGSHNYNGHDQAIYEEQTHIPLIIAFSDGRYGGSRVPEMTRQIDLLPSIAAALGKEKRPAWEGGPQWPFADTATDRRAFITRRLPKDDEEWPHERLYGLREDNWKLLWTPKQDRILLFDLTKDPRERLDVGDSNQDKRREMVDWVSTKVKKMNGRGPKKENPILPSHVEELKSLGYLQ